MFQRHIGGNAHQARKRQKCTVSQRPGDALRHHREFRHAAHTGQDVDRHEDDAENGELVDAPVLVDVDETDGGVHQEIDLVKQEGSVAVERLDVAQHLLGIIKLCRRPDFASHQKVDGALGIENIAADATIQIFFFRNVAQYGGSFTVTDGFTQDLTPDLAQGGVDVFQGIGRVLDIGTIQIEQNIIAVGHIAGLCSGAPALQAKHREFLVAQGEEDSLVQDKGNRNAA